jgi:S1-C subfamily serine protease
MAASETLPKRKTMTISASPASTPDVAELVARIAPSVVGLAGHRHRLGSAILWQAGVLVASASALGRERRPVVLAADGGRLEAEVAGIDFDTDLAVLRVTGLEGAAPIPVDAGAEAPARVGDFVFAVAHDARAGVQASFGRLGAVGGAWRGGRGAEIERWLRLDGGLYPGFEGAAVADAAGCVLGLATSAFSRVHGVVLPAATIARVLPVLLSEGRVPRPYLGVMVQPARVRVEGEAAVVDGALVSSVAEGGPADAGGLRVGDVLVALGGQALDGPEALQRGLRSMAAGAPQDVEVVRGGARRTLQVTPGTRPAPESTQGACCR